MRFDFCQRCVRMGDDLILFRPTSQNGVAQLYQMSDEDLVAYAQQHGLVE